MPRPVLWSTPVSVLRRGLVACIVSSTNKEKPAAAADREFNTRSWCMGRASSSLADIRSDQIDSVHVNAIARPVNDLPMRTGTIERTLLHGAGKHVEYRAARSRSGCPGRTTTLERLTTTMQSKATTVEQYLAELPEDRRKAIEAVRQVVLKNLDKDYEEGIQYGMIGYYVPHRVYPAGYHCDPKQPLPFAELGVAKEPHGALSHVRLRRYRPCEMVSGSVGQDRQEARYGQVVRAVQEG